MIRALVTHQGTATPETALCSKHWDIFHTGIENDVPFEDIYSAEWHDVTGNELCPCIECGAEA